ncbi:MAG: enoyl-CoA hydratase/isomerase family protein [Solirubrobacterales bacterium]|nr:enoyl-CoA hydratase/isomerase family protein [Solirubrobacterales bacterium]
MRSVTELTTEVLEQAGLSPGKIRDWSLSTPPSLESFEAAAQALSGFLARGAALDERLPAAAGRSDVEQAAAGALGAALAAARVAFLDAHAAELYDRLTAGCSRPIRLERLLDEAAGLVPGLVPSPAEMEAERRLPLSDKRGLELAQGLLVEQVLALPRAGRHLIESMLAPTPEALEMLPRYLASGVGDFGAARVTRQGRAAVLELRNPRHLNAEDGATLAPTESAVDLVVLDPETEVGVFRGAVVEHPRYAGERVFGSGINLTHLYRGRIDFLFYLVRDLGYVSKIYRGLITQDGPVEKLWIAAVERYAIGGGCQLLHVVDHVIATRGSRLYLPARREGIIPGASNLRLPRAVGDRAARQAILSGREWTAGEADADLLIDEVTEPGDMDAAIASRVEELTSSGLVNAAANRRALRVGQEPLELFRRYMATYAHEQAYCHLSPALVRNLEQHWDAARRAE